MASLLDMGLVSPAPTGLLALTPQEQDNARSLGLLALAGGMIRGDFGGGLSGFGQTYQDAQQTAIKNKLAGLQAENLQSEVQARNIALQRQQQLLSLLPKVLSATPAPQQGQLGSGTYGIVPTAPGVPSIPQSGGGGIGNASIGDLATIEALGGPKLLDYYKAANEGFERKPGSFYDIPGQGRQYIADPTKSIDFNPNTKQVSVLPGALDTQTALTFATEAPKTLLSSAAQVNLRKNANGTETPVSSLAENPTLQSVLGGIFSRVAPGAPTVAAPQPAPQRAPAVVPQADPFANLPAPQAGITAGTFQGKPEDVIGAIANIKDPQERSNAYQSFKLQMAQNPANVSTLGPQYGQTTQQQNEAAANKQFLEGRAKGANDYEANLNGRVAQGTELNMRLQEQLAALDKFRAGGGAETRAQLAQMAQAIPKMPQWVVNGIAGGDISAMQEFNKLAAQTAMEQLKQSMGGAGRVSQYEFKVFQNNNPNLSTDPNAIRKVFEFTNRIYRRDLAEQQGFNNYVKSGGDPANFPSVWAQQLASQGVTQPNMNTGAQPQSLPTPIKGMVRNGYRFKGGDPSNQASWEKI